VYETLANAVALIHAGLIALVVGGALVATTPRVVTRFPRWLIVAYLISVAGTFLSYLLLGDCVMTQWEKTLRDQAVPGSAYGETFLQHYFALLPGGLTQSGHFAPWLGVVIGVTAWAFLQLRHATRDGESNRRSLSPPADRSP
jgi:hypothetical protein